MANEGYVPNFASEEKIDGIRSAIRREESFGNQAQILFSDRLQTPVVVNDKQVRKYGKDADRIITKDHIERGQKGSKANLMKTGSGKEQYKSGDSFLTSKLISSGEWVWV